MNNTIEYDIRDGVINPEYIGIITEPRDENYRFEDFRITPKTVQKIDAHIQNDSPLEYTVSDCHDEYELSSDKPSLIVDNLHYQKGEMAVAHNGVEKYSGEPFNMACVPVDAVNLNVNDPMQLKIKNSDSHETLYSRDIYLYDYISIDSSVLSHSKESL